MSPEVADSVEKVESNATAKTSLKLTQSELRQRNVDAARNQIGPRARAVGVVGDRWTVLILRELFMRIHRFEEIQAQTGATPQMIAARLKKLEADGLAKRCVYNKRPLRHEYHLTEKGEAFYPVILALRAWGETSASHPRTAGP
jgi:DNA-binding HxlR family transcriptional regulator